MTNEKHALYQLLENQYNIIRTLQIENIKYSNDLIDANKEIKKLQKDNRRLIRDLTRIAQENK